MPLLLRGARQVGKTYVIEKFGKEVEEAVANQSVVIHLEDDVDVSRGDLIVKKENSPRLSQQLEVFLCWMDTKPLVTGSKYLLQLKYEAHL